MGFLGCEVRLAGFLDVDVGKGLEVDWLLGNYVVRFNRNRVWLPWGAVDVMDAREGAFHLLAFHQYLAIIIVDIQAYNFWKRFLVLLKDSRDRQRLLKFRYLM